VGVKKRKEMYEEGWEGFCVVREGIFGVVKIGGGGGGGGGGARKHRIF